MCPLPDPSAARPPRRSSPRSNAAAAARAAPQGRGVILGVEDDPLSQILMREFGRALGLEVELADSAAAAEAALAAGEGRIGLVLLDMNIGDERGQDVLARLRARFGVALPPVIAHSADPRWEDPAQQAAAGLDDAMPKPLRPPLLAELAMRYGLL